MTDGHEIPLELIKAKGPDAFLTTRQKVERVAKYVFYSLTVALTTLGGFLYVSQRSIECTNAQLKQRNVIAQRDSQAHVDWAKAALTFLNTPTSDTDAQKVTAFETFVTKTATYVTTLTADQTFRDAHPLGTC